MKWFRATHGLCPRKAEDGLAVAVGAALVLAGASEGTMLPGILCPQPRPVASTASLAPEHVCPPAALPKCQPQESSRNPSFPFAWIPISSQSLIIDDFRLPCFSCFGLWGWG